MCIRYRYMRVRFGAGGVIQRKQDGDQYYSPVYSGVSVLFASSERDAKTKIQALMRGDK